MINLLQETLEVLKSNGKSPDDVIWVGDREKKTTWSNFESISNFQYDAGYGGNEIDGSLLVVGKDWWLERGEYDGSEWWEFKEYPSCESTGFTKLLNVREHWYVGLEWENQDEK